MRYFTHQFKLRFTIGTIIVKSRTLSSESPYLTINYSTKEVASHGTLIASTATVNEILFYDLDQSGVMDYATVLSLRWGELDNILALFPRLQAVTFSFENPSSWSAGRLYCTCLAIANAMPKIRASGRLGFRYGDQTLSHKDSKAAWLGGILLVKSIIYFNAHSPSVWLLPVTGEVGDATDSEAEFDSNEAYTAFDDLSEPPLYVLMLQGTYQ